MPFTLAHPAAVLPLARSRLPFPALVVGAMAPDLEYMLRLDTQSAISHTLPGLFIFCVPAGLVVLCLYARLPKAPLLALLPHVLRSRFARTTNATRSGPPGLAVTLCALLVGAATHLLWDAFTHADGWAVAHLPFLRWPVLETPLGSPRVYRVLQHASSLAGLAVIAYAAWRTCPAPSRRESTDAPAAPAGVRWHGPALLAAAALLALLGAWLRRGLPHDFTGLREFTVMAIIAGLDAVLLVGAAYALAAGRSVADAGRVGESRPDGRETSL